MNEESPNGKLDGLRIATTREHAGVLDDTLRAEGADVRHIPLIRVVSAADASGLQTALQRIGDYAWLVFTSTKALRLTMAAGGQAVLAAESLAVACVGETTAAEAAELGLQVSMVPERQHVKGLIEAFAALERRDVRVLYPRSEIAPSTLKEGLQALGFLVDDPVAYRTLPDDHGMKQLKDQLDELHAIAFASPSAVENAWSAVGDDLRNVHIYTIGPSTSAAVRAHGLTVQREAAVHRAEALGEIIIRCECHHD